MAPVIQASSLSKTFKVTVPRPGVLGSLINLFYRRSREISAVNNISFSIQPGEFVGFIGPNGAGKSTTIKMLTGILTPTSGTLSVNGLVPHLDRKKLALKIGAVFGQRTQLWWDLPVRDSFELLRHIYLVPKPAYLDRLKYFVELLDVTPFLDQPVRKLSLGQRMRADLVASLLHDPEILFLDEPTIGLDLHAKAAIRDFLEKLNKEAKKTILLTTHDLIDIDTLCQRLIVIDQGVILFDGNLDSLKKSFVDHSRLLIKIDDPVKMKTLTDFLEKLQVTDIAVQEPEIEDIVRRLYSR